MAITLSNWPSFNMSKYIIENLGAPGEFLSCHGDNFGDLGQSLKIWDNPHSPVTQWYIFKVGDNEYNIANVYSKKCVNVSRHDKFNGSRVFQWDNPDKKLSKFAINHHPARDDRGDYYTIESCYTPTHALNVSGNKTTAGAEVILWNNRATWSTQWKIRKIDGDTYDPKKATLPFDPNQWAQPHIHAFLGSKGFQEMPADQVAALATKKRYTIESRNAPGKFVSSHGVPLSGYKIAEGANLVLCDNPGSKESQWHILGAGGDPQRFIFVNAASQKTLAVSRHNRRSGGPVLQSAYPFSEETIFRIHHRDGAYTIESVYSGGKYLHSGEEKANATTKIYTWDNAWIHSSQFIITEVGGARL